MSHIITNIKSNLIETIYEIIINIEYYKQSPYNRNKICTHFQYEIKLIDRKANG